MTQIVKSHWRQSRVRDHLFELIGHIIGLKELSVRPDKDISVLLISASEQLAIFVLLCFQVQQDLTHLREHLIDRGAVFGLCPVVEDAVTVDGQDNSVHSDIFAVLRDVTELKSEYLADTKRQPHCQQTGKLNIGFADNIDELFSGREILARYELLCACTDAKIHNCDAIFLL